MDNEKMDELIKIKLEEKPSKEYFENYLPRFKNRLGPASNPISISANRRFVDSLIPKFSFAFNAALLALLILFGGLFYAQNQQIKLLQFTQEEEQKVLYKQLSQLRARINLPEKDFGIGINISKNVPVFDKIEKTVKIRGSSPQNI